MQTRRTKPAIRLLLSACLASVALASFSPLKVCAAHAPGITTQPQSQSVETGSNAVFQVVASGDLPLSYQWSFTGANLVNSSHIGGATSATLTVSNVTVNDAGPYKVVVSNSHGTATSSNATLTVLVPATITTQPTNQAVLLSGNVTFSAAATGTLPVAVQWYFNGALLTDGGGISGSATTNLTIANIQSGNAGSYQFVATNNYGSATSAVATLTVLVPAMIVSQPTNQSVVLSSNVTFAASAIGTSPLAYQWYLNGAALTDGAGITGSTTADLNLSNAQTNDAGAYELIVTNDYGSATSIVATLTVLLPPNIVTSPTNQRVLQGGNASFSVTATGTQPLSYQWQKNGVDLVDGGSISGSATPTLTITNLQFSDAGQYLVVVSNAYGTATSAAATLGVATNLPPLSNSVGVWGDYDNEGLMDVLLAGDVQGVTNFPNGRFTRLYHNAGNGIFDDSGVVLPQLDSVSAAWGDFNNDGKLDLLLSGLEDGTNGPVSFTDVYQNDGNNHFTKLNLGLEPVAEGSVAWVDYDNDGRPDIFETGYDTTTSNWVAQIYHNNGDGTFTLAVTNLPVLPNATGYWGDYDNDGAPDLLLSGSGTNYLLHNNGGGNFSNSGVSIPTQYVVVGPWGDYDGDGYLDFIISPATVPSPVLGPDYHPTFYHNSGNGTFSTDTDQSLNMWVFDVNWGDIDNSGRASLVVTGWAPLVAGGGVWSSETQVYTYLGSSWSEDFMLADWDNFSTWVDYTGDGALDIFSTGGNLTTFWNNNIATHRDSPQPPLNPAVVFTGLDGVLFSWQSPSNTPATGRALSYNVRVGSTPGGVDVVSPMADPATGRRLIPALGNAGAAQLFVLTNLPPGNYYWAVQSIGQSYTGSPFTAEGQFTVTSSPPVVVTQPTNQSVLSGYNTGFSAYVIGTKPLAYQWFENGEPLTDNQTFSGSTTPTLTVSNAQPNLNGAFDLVITNNYGSATSAVVTLYVNGAPRILSQPVSLYVLPGGSARFSVSAAGTAPLNYQWCFNGAPLTDNGNFTGSATPAISVQNVGTNDAGAFTVVITNDWGAVTSSVASLFIATAHYVNVNNPSPSAPYTTWATAATVIQNAIDAANVGDWIIVTNGTYATGGRQVGSYNQKWNRVVMTNQVTVISVNGPQVTTILGDVPPNTAYYGTRCVWLGGGSTLSGFTVTGGGNYYGEYSEDEYDIEGGGIYGQASSAVVSDCIITGNSGCWYGGGVYNATVINCLLTGNNAFQSGQAGQGGPAYDCTLINCTVVGNLDGGGVVASTCENSIVYDNPTNGPSQGNAGSTSMTYSCTTPNPGGVGNTTNDPMFVNYAGGDYRLQTGSPCINSGSNAFITMSTDLDGHPRIVDGVVDMGAYEYQHVPWFLVPPTNQTILAGSTLVLTATVLGDPSIYQWYYNGAPLSDGGRILGSASNTLTIAMTVTNDSGNYWITASNSFGVTTSAVATVTVLPPLAITSEPTNLVTLTFSNATFTVGAIGFAPPAYSWYSNGVALTNGGRISGANTATLSITDVQTNDSGGAYQAIVTNIYGAVTSSVATLTVVAPVQITSQPMSQDAILGGNATFTVVASGSAPLSYQWYFDGAPLTDGGGISGSATATLGIANVQNNDAGSYYLVVSNLLTSARSLTASLTPESVIAPSVRYVMLSNTNPTPPYLNWSTAATNIQDAVDASVAGDTVLVSNGTYSVGGRVFYGTTTNRLVVNKSVTVQSLNGPAGTTIAGILSLGVAHPIRCAYLTNNAVLTGFTLLDGGTLSSGNTVTNESGGGVWCDSPSTVVSNCVFIQNGAQYYAGGAYGGTLINCLLTNNTAGSGGGAASNVLLNCTLTKNIAGNVAGNGNGAAGGGAFGSTLSNCLLVANSASSGAGAYGGVLFDCVLMTNTAGEFGGGGYSGVFYNCILENNSSRDGGATYLSLLYNCTVVSNTAGDGAGIYGGSAMNCIIYYNYYLGLQGNTLNSKSIAYTCTFPAIGIDCITNPPLFVNLSVENLQLQSNSPCINSGNNAAVTTATDLAGNPRIVGGTVDMGAYEYQTPSSVISYAYLQQYGLPTDGSADYASLDGTPFNVYQDWIAGLNPTNPASILAMLPLLNTTNTSGITVRWQSVSGINYNLQRSTNLLAQPTFSTIQSNIPGLTGTTIYGDTTATNKVQYFYRVNVQKP